MDNNEEMDSNEIFLSNLNSTLLVTLICKLGETAFTTNGVNTINSNNAFFFFLLLIIISNNKHIDITSM